MWDAKNIIGVIIVIVHLTKKLADKLKLTPDVMDTHDGLLSWRANYAHGHGHHFIVFMNDASRFSIVISDVRAATLRRLPEFFYRALQDTLLSMCVNPKVVKQYMKELGEFSYAKNSDPKKTAQVTKNTDTVWCALRNRFDDVSLSVFVNQIPYSISGSNDALFPNEKMLELLGRYGLPVQSSRAFDLHVRLALDGRDAVRRLRVPATFSFAQLHHLLQTAFGWQNRHLYSFGMYREWGEDVLPAPVIELAIGQDDFDDHSNESIMTDYKLSKYMPKYNKILYSYDFADGWQLYIQIEDVIEDFREDLPLLLSGEGDAPPEDVGGPKGFTKFLDIISHPSHDEYKAMMRWARSRLWCRFDFDLFSGRINPRSWRVNHWAKRNESKSDGSQL